jgi:hypothetical protein
LEKIVGGEGQENQRGGKQQEMNFRLSPMPQAITYPVGIEIPTQKKNLEEEHAGGPNCRTTSKPRQDRTGEQGLDEEQEKSTEKHRTCVSYHKEFSALFYGAFPVRTSFLY